MRFSDINTDDITAPARIWEESLNTDLATRYIYPLGVAQPATVAVWGIWFSIKFSLMGRSVFELPLFAGTTSTPLNTPNELAFGIDYTGKSGASWLGQASPNQPSIRGVQINNQGYAAIPCFKFKFTADRVVYEVQRQIGGGIAYMRGLIIISEEP